MTLVIEGKKFWTQSPFYERAKQLKLKGIDVQAVHTDKTLRLECKCGVTSIMDCKEKQEEWGWTKCSGCQRPHLVHFI